MTLTAPAPTTDTESRNLFPEARRRTRRRRIVLAASITVVGIAVGVSLSQGGTPPNEPGLFSRPGDDGSSVPATGHFVVRGNGIAHARFGQPESVAITNLEGVLGLPLDRAPVPSRDCTVDAYLQWSRGLLAMGPAHFWAELDIEIFPTRQLQRDCGSVRL